MTAFTSTQTGNWNDGATWGNTSPGAKGTDWPGLAGDTAIIANTHVVTYNVSESNVLGAVTINSGGTLKFSRSANTLLTIGNVDLTVNGVLDIGTIADPIPAAYTAVVDHQSAASSNELYAGSTGEIYICGDPNYFGSSIMATLQANYTTGQTFTIVGDYTSKWSSGMTLLLIKDGEFSSQNTDTVIVTIDTVAANGDNTDITINEAFPGGTYSADANVFNFSRNVRYILNGSLSGPVANSYDSTCGELDIDLAVTTELSACEIGWGYLLNMIGATINYVSFYDHYNFPSFTGCSISNTIIYSSVNPGSLRNCHGSDLSIICCDSGQVFGDCTFNIFRVINHYNYFFNNYCSNTFLGNVEVYKCSTGYFAPLNVVAGDKVILSGHFGENANALSYWTNDTVFGFSSTTYTGFYLIVKDFYAPGTVVQLGDGGYRNANYGVGHIFVEAVDGDRTDPRMVGMYGDASMVTADGSGVEPSQRSGGGASVWKVVTLSSCDVAHFVQVPVKLRYLISSPPASLSIKVYIQSNYVGSINYKLVLIQNGIASSSVGTISARSAQSDWSQYAEIAETFTVDGYAEILLYVWGYESGKFIWIDPVISVS